MAKAFLSTPSARRATEVHEAMDKYIDEFLSTPSARRATRSESASRSSPANFYPRPPRGGRRTEPRAGREAGNFYPRPPRGGRRHRGGRRRVGENFYPRPPRGGRPRAGHIAAHFGNISIHALREEGDAIMLETCGCPVEFLSTPSARRATDFADADETPEIFLSTPSARRATHKVYAQVPTENISIHALREEGDNFCPECGRQLKNFYPRPPRGGRHQLCRRCPQLCRISIHALREEGDCRPLNHSTNSEISIHALREEGDARH